MVVQGFRSELVRPRGALLITLQWSHRHKQDFLRRSQGEEASFSHWPAIWAAPLLLLCCKQAVRRSQGTPLPIVPSPLTSLSSLGIAGIYEYTGWRSKLVLRSLLHGSSLEGPRLLPAPPSPNPSYSCPKVWLPHYARTAKLNGRGDRKVASPVVSVNGTHAFPFDAYHSSQLSCF